MHMKFSNLSRSDKRILFWFIVTLLMAVIPWFVI